MPGDFSKPASITNIALLHLKRNSNINYIDFTVVVPSTGQFHI